MTHKKGTKEEQLEMKLTQTREFLNQATDLLEKERTAAMALKNKVAGGFYMMSRTAEKNLRELQLKSPTGALVFSVIREHMGIGTNAVTISNNVLCEMLNVSRPTISRAIKFLKENRYVQIIKTGTTNTYVVNERIAFSGTPGQRKAVFSASVVAHECEQEKGFDEPIKLKSMAVFYDDERPILNASEQLPPPDQQDLELN